MTGQTPLVVGLPVFNGERYLEAALRSVLAQTYGDFVLLISDNASTDTTAEICRDLAATDSRIEYVRLPSNVGANKNFNHVARLAQERHSPRWFKWAAHDDLCEPRFLEACIKVLDVDDEVVLAYPVTVMIDEFGVPIPDARDPGPKGTGTNRLDRFREILRDEFGVFYIFGVHRTSALTSTTLFGPHWPPDKALASWLALLGRFEQVQEPLFLRRTHPAQSSSLTLRNQARWSSSGLGRLVPSPVAATQAYLRGIREAPLIAAERRAAYRAVAGKYVDPAKWKRVLLPGRDNYLGWSGRDRDTVNIDIGADQAPPPGVAR